MTTVRQNELSEFKIWLSQLDAVAASYANIGYVQSTGEDCWRSYFEDGYSPEEAYQEDCSYD